MRVSILGCGVYGLALASSFLHKGYAKVCMWNKFDEEIIRLRDIHHEIDFTSDMERAVNGTDLIVIAIPVSFLEDTVITLKKFYQGQDILIASKGIDTRTQKFAYEIVLEYLKEASIGVVSGGTFARDMSDKKVMGLTIGTKFKSIEEKVKLALESDFLKVQYTHDIVGVSVCGSIKNVMAIGFGMLDGANYPPSSRFLFLTEAIYEIQNLICVLGGNKETVMSYAGIDDIMMTCTSKESRNYTFGFMIGSKKTEDEISEYKATTTIEGLGTSEAIYTLAKSKNISLPLSDVIYHILYDGSDYMELIYLLEKRES